MGCYRIMATVEKIRFKAEIKVKLAYSQNVGMVMIKFLTLMSSVYTVRP